MPPPRLDQELRRETCSSSDRAAPTRTYLGGRPSLSLRRAAPARAARRIRRAPRRAARRRQRRALSRARSGDRLQDVLTCIREKCTIREAGLRLEKHAERHLKSGEEMARLFAILSGGGRAHGRDRGSLQLLARRAELRIPRGAGAARQDAAATSRGSDLAPRAAGATERRFRQRSRELLRDELALIEELDYAHYFLTVYDVVAFAKSKGILCQGRGSAANSAVCYCLGITAVDPEQDQRALRPLHLGRPRRAARHRRRFRA